MRISKLCPWYALVMAAAVVALPSTASTGQSIHIDNTQPAPAYPIGQVKGANAKVAGRLFDIDGKVEYFAGMPVILSDPVIFFFFLILKKDNHFNIG